MATDGDTPARLRVRSVAFIRPASMDAPAMSDHDEQATRHLERALEEDVDGPWLHVAAAGIHALLHISDNLRHGLRDIVYELRD